MCNGPLLSTAYLRAQYINWFLFVCVFYVFTCIVLYVMLKFNEVWKWMKSFFGMTESEREGERGRQRERKTATDWDRVKWFGRTEQSRATREHDEMNRILLKYENPKCTFFIGTTQAGSKFWAHSVLKESMNSIIHWSWSWMWKK